MSMIYLRRFAGKLPIQWQQELKRVHFRRRIRQGTFISEEPEFSLLTAIVHPGDWVVDVGANVGFYTKRLADLVGSEGRVLAFEPIPETFVLLANNLESCQIRNVTLFNSALSDGSILVGMSIPKFDETGQRNYYQAHITRLDESEIKILTIALDSLDISSEIRLIKIDAEGHEFSVIRGMVKTLRRHNPILIDESGREDVWELLESLNYVGKRIPKSPNVVFHPNSITIDALESLCSAPR